MSDIRVSMREFRFLEEKRKLAALSESEERRWNELGQMLGIFANANGNRSDSGVLVPPFSREGPESSAVPTESQACVPPLESPLPTREMPGSDAPGEPAGTSEAALAGGREPPAKVVTSRIFPDATVDPAPPNPQDGIAEVDADDVMEVDPSDVFLVEPGGQGNASPASGDSPPAVDGSAQEGESTIPLTKNFEWIPGAASEPAPTNAETEPGASVQTAGSDSPVIDLLESDAAQGELQPSSSGEEPMEIEPVAQWTTEPVPAPPQHSGQVQPARPQQSKHAQAAPPQQSDQVHPSRRQQSEQAQAAQPQQPDRASGGERPSLKQSYPADSASGTKPSQVSSSISASSSFQFEVTGPAKPDPAGMVSSPALPDVGTQTQPASPNESPGANLPEVHRGDAAKHPAQADPQSGDGKALVSGFLVAGERRVVVHLIDGQVKRGTVRDLDLMASSVSLHATTGAVDHIPIERLKAIFFMLPVGSGKPVLQGQKIRVTFQDGREVVGFSSDFKTGQPGFFLTPADARTNTERIFVLRWGILSIAEH